MPHKIFLAEDDDNMRFVIAFALQADGYKVVEARDGSELLELLAAASPLQRPDVVVSDVMMPGYTGLGVLAALYRSDWHVPVILITARRDDALVGDALRLGASAVLRKPFDIDDLRTAILSVTASSPIEANRKFC